ncbi:MAG: hypothetical protein ACLQVX_10595 [Limisphaerales bacterium]
MSIRPRSVKPSRPLPATGQKTLTQTYAKCILFDHSYKFFYQDGYGKYLHILNLAEEHEGEIGLRVGENPWFGVVNVGDSKKLCDLSAEWRGADENF